MVQELARVSNKSEFPETAPAANPVFFRTYSRRTNQGRETWADVCDRTISGLTKLGKLTSKESALLDRMQRQLKTTVAARYLWVGNTPWLEEPENFSGAFNCTSRNINDWESFGIMMDLAMKGCGTGAVLEPQYINQLPSIRNHLTVKIVKQIGITPQELRREETELKFDGNNVYMHVGDSRQGWVKSYQTIMELSTDERFTGDVEILVDLSDVRPAGEPLKGFGGVANPVKLAALYERCATILNKAINRQLNSVECCLLIDEAATTVVAGNIRRCLPENALVNTSTGLVPIRDVQVGDLVQTPIGLRPIVNKFDQGFQDVYDIKVDSDLPVKTYPRATLNHRIAVNNSGLINWVKVEDLSRGDQLIYLDFTSDQEVKPHVTVKELGSYNHVQTYDIEVEEAHCFYCDGYLTHNSAGMRQFNSEDELAATAKDNLWTQDENGNWRIDPERDVLRMANHTRVYHNKPSLEECINAVRKQYYSGEGAIQWAGEAIARASADLIATPEQKRDFLSAYSDGKAQDWFRANYPNIDSKELEHRLGRYGLNPCVTADTWIHTEMGARQVKDLIGLQHAVYVNGELFSTTPEGFFFTGNKPVIKLQTKEGYSLRLTDNHQVLKVTAQTEKNQYSEWCEAGNLQIGDRILMHNHRHLQPWDGVGNFEQGWLLGNSFQDGYFARNQAHQLQVKEYALALNDLPKKADLNTRDEISASNLADLANIFGLQDHCQAITPEIEQGSYEFYRGFLRGLFDANGSVQKSQANEINIRLSHSNLPGLEAVQRMLLRIGIGSTIGQNSRSNYGDLSPDLVISNDNINIFAELIGFQDRVKSELLTNLLSGNQRPLNQERFAVEIAAIIPDGMEPVYDCTVPQVSRFDANGFVAHNCGEIIGADFHCNLSQVHLDQIDPKNHQEQEEAFTAAAIAAATMLQRTFIEPRFHQSRKWDPIVGVSFGGLFDFFVQAFGVEWLRWWEEGRPNTAKGIDFKLQEQEYLTTWKKITEKAVWEYCDRHFLKRPNRCTTVQPSGTKVLLTGGSPGWHPPKSQRFIRRITFNKNNPIALACIDFGYNVVPSSDDKDINGNLLNNPFDERCTTWLVEIPTEVIWANLPGADEIEIGKFSALAQFDFFMQVQKFFVTHNTSSTIELYESEVEALGKEIYQAIKDDQGYISTAILARFDDHETFPRLPFEPITKQEYEQLNREVLQRRKNPDFVNALSRYDGADLDAVTRELSREVGPAGCDTDRCLLPEQKPS